LTTISLCVVLMFWFAMSPEGYSISKYKNKTKRISKTELVIGGLVESVGEMSPLRNAVEKL